MSTAECAAWYTCVADGSINNAASVYNIGTISFQLKLTRQECTEHPPALLLSISISPPKCSNKWLQSVWVSA